MELHASSIAFRTQNEAQSKRLDIFATAIFHGMRVDAVEQLDLSYTPPLSSPWDPVQTSCMEWVAEPSEGRA